MPKYVAFLRAINVGGHTVKMDQLRELFAALGFRNVETFIASGNVIFDAPSKNTAALEKKIESHLLKSLGYAVATFLRSPAELAGIAQHQPFADSVMNADADTLYIGFMGAVPGDAAKEKLLALSTKTDVFQLNNREVFWLLRTRFSDSEFSGGKLEKTLGLPVTLRNSTTVKKIAAKYS
jgi:uncharacterized protein (DUF1697 family)